MKTKQIPLALTMGLLIALSLSLLLTACGPTTPTSPPPTTPAATATRLAAQDTPPPTPTAAPSPAPTDTPRPTPTAPPQATAAGNEPPPLADLRATVVAGLPPTPTPETPGDESLWGEIAILPLDTGGASPPLWAAFTVGMTFYDLDHGHLIAIYTTAGDRWELLGQVTLTDCAQYVDTDSLRQVQVAPGAIWLEMESGAGAHGGCYDLFRFDGQTLHHDVSHFNSSPGAGNLADLDGDGVAEVLLNQTENYVFCYACGVRLPWLDILRWDGAAWNRVELTELPASAPEGLRTANNRAVELAQAMLWKDAAQTIAQIDTAAIQDPALAETVTWNSILIGEEADSLREEAQDGPYPLLSNLFYGDYGAALEIMRSYSPEEIWDGPESPLIAGTPAEDWETALSDWISQTTGLALEAQPDLAAAYFMRAWGLHLVAPDDPQVVDLVERAAALDPQEALFTTSLRYLTGGSAHNGPPAPLALRRPPLV